MSGRDALDAYHVTTAWSLDDLESFFEQFPSEPVKNAALLDIWHTAYHEATTVPWITLGSQTVEV